MEMQLHYHSTRARQARMGALLAKKWVQFVLDANAVLLLLAGLGLLFVGSSFGWLLLGLMAPFWMILAWGASLRNVPVGPHEQHVDQVLETQLLAALPVHFTVDDLLGRVAQSHGGNFYTTRFLISFEYIQSELSKQPVDTNIVWQKALQYRDDLGHAEVSSAALALAFIESVPGIEQYLAQLSVDIDDIRSGLQWYRHVDELIAETKKERAPGGIGRDWAFGYTPLLDRFGVNISEQIAAGGILTRHIIGHQDTIAAVTKTLAQSGKHNATLVGQLGSGKTKLVHTFAAQLLKPDHTVPASMRYNQVVALDPSVLISQARGRGELEHLMQELCYEALTAKNVILFLDDAQLFFEEHTGSVDLSNVLLPMLDGGALRIVLAMDEQRWLQITRSNPQLGQYLNRIMVAPASEQETIEIMQNQLVMYEYQHKVYYTYQALQAAYRLGSRFQSELVMPGRALKILESAATYAETSLVTKKSVETAIEKTQGVKVATADTLAERETLLNLEELIHKRMINQNRAVKVVSDALRRARAGVGSTNRPIGTFLFLGPTGVGKTELAKSVAAVFFNDESNLIRLDLNEYVRSEDVSRLIADPTQDSHSLTAQIARNPYSVVLLDEIEKAHPNVLNTLLQMLDEGILRDINNREISFRDAVIIATSNAGAERIRAHIDAGENLEQFEEAFTDELITSNIFRPEFLNRFDEIVLFRPLTEDELLQVVDLILVGVNKTLASQKIAVEVADDAKRLLVSTGYDPRLGARPMRRIVQRTVENIVAQQVLSQDVSAGGVVTVTKEDVTTSLARR
jgi:ATP-dependent Clp protease ATP-binding subunit ClpC